MWTLLMALGLGAEPSLPAIPPEIPLDAVVRVVQGGGTCAGAFVDDQGTVATAYHCVAHGGRPMVWTREGAGAVGRVVVVDAARDLALIEVAALAGAPWIPLADTPPVLGERVRAIGHPMGSQRPSGYVEGLLRWSVSEGIVSGVGPRAIQTTAPVNPGNSGGPLVDAEGRLVGVVSRRFGGQGLGFASRADDVSALMEGEGAPFGPLGGTLAADVFVGTYQSGLGSVTIGARLEAAFRDRVVLGVAGAFPLDARWTVTRFDDAVRWSQAEARAGLRQRFGRGPWTAMIEGFGGVAAVQTLAPSDRFRFRTEGAAAPMAGGAFTIRGITLDVAGLFAEDRVDLRVLVVLRFPGVIWMF